MLQNRMTTEGKIRGNLLQRLNEIQNEAEKQLRNFSECLQKDRGAYLGGLKESADLISEMSPQQLRDHARTIEWCLRYILWPLKFHDPLEIHRKASMLKGKDGEGWAIGDLAHRALLVLDEMDEKG